VKDVTGANDTLAQSLPEDGAKTLLVLGLGSNGR
jgi:hypothetical protein